MITDKTIRVHVVSAEAEIYSGLANMVIAPAVLGDVGVLPGHTPMLTQLRPGELRIFLGDEQAQHVYVSGGMLEIQPDEVLVLADTVVRAAELDEARVLEAKARVEQMMANKDVAMDYARLQVQMSEISAQLQIIRRLKK